MKLDFFFFNLQKKKKKKKNEKSFVFQKNEKNDEK